MKTEIYDSNGEHLGAFPLTESHLKRLKSGALTVTYHTPQRLREALGDRHGSFELTRDGERIVASNPAEVKRAIELFEAIENA